MISILQADQSCPPPRVSPRTRQQIAVLLISFGCTMLVLTASAYTWMNLKQRALLSQAASFTMGADQKVGDEVIVLSIPKIKMEAAVLPGTDSEALLEAPGHMEQTPWPGDPGNSVVAGHRDSFFRKIHLLSNGDDIYVRRARHQYHYVVDDKVIVDPNDLSVTLPTSDARLTLVTCYPTYYVGPAPKRLIIKAVLVDSFNRPGEAPEEGVGKVLSR